MSWNHPRIQVTPTRHECKRSKRNLYKCGLYYHSDQKRGVSQTIIPRGDTVYKLNDQVYFSVPHYSIENPYPVVGKEHLNIKNVMIF